MTTTNDGASPVLTLRVSRAEAVARQLERDIFEQHEPGVRLGTKDELRTRFGVAAATINEAMRMLEMRGLIEARPGPGGGIFVARPAMRVALTRHAVLGFHTDMATYEDCLRVRDALEPLICRDAAAHHRASDIRALEAILRRMERHVNDPAGYFKANWALHRRLARLTRNAPLLSIYLTLTDYLEATLEQAEYREFDGPAAIQVHRELVAAIDAGPGPSLQQAISAHTPSQDPG